MLTFQTREYRRARSGSKTAEDVVRLNASRCEAYLRRSQGGPTRTRVGYRTELATRDFRTSCRPRSRSPVAKIPLAQEISMAHSIPAPRRMPQALTEYRTIERGGISAALITEATDWLMSIPAVSHFCDRRGVRQVAAKKFFVHVAYSIHAMGSLRLLGGEASENTLLIGVGPDIQHIDDVKPFGILWKNIMAAGLSVADGITYIQVAHDLVRPGIVHALANVVLVEGAPPEKEYVKSVLQRLLRRHAGAKRRTDQDMLHLNKTQTRAHQYAGTAILNQKLKNHWDQLRTMSRTLADDVRQEQSFGQLAEHVAAVGLPGMQNSAGYWTNHLIRLFTSEFSGIKLPGRIPMDTAGRKNLLSMGEGSQALKLLGITSANVDTQLPQLCRAVEALASAVGRPCTVTEPQMVVAACESHRRGGLTAQTGGIRRRYGL